MKSLHPIHLTRNSFGRIFQSYGLWNRIFYLFISVRVQHARDEDEGKNSKTKERVKGRHSYYELLWNSGQECAELEN